MGSDKLGRTQGYKRIVSVGMEIEQPGYAMGENKPSWFKDINAIPNSWHLDSSGPYEFSFLPAKKNLTEIFVAFAEGVPDNKKWKWVNEYMGSNSYGSSGMVGCGSHVHLGTMQPDWHDKNSKSLIQTTILWNTAVTMLPFSGKWLNFGPDNTFRDKAFSGWRYAPLKDQCKRYNPSTMSMYMRTASGREDAFITLNRNTGKDKLTFEIRGNEAMPQWVLPYIDMFLLIAYKHIEVGESPKLKNHRAVLEWLHDQYEQWGKIHDMDYIIEFAEGKELYAPVPHVIGEKFPRKMTIGEFLHLIDRVAYWVFAFSSRKYYTNQMRFMALGGDPSKLPIPMMWRPWKYKVKEMMEASGDGNKFVSARKAANGIFPKNDNRTHSPFAHVRLGDKRTVSDDEQEANEFTDEPLSASDILSSLISEPVNEDNEGDDLLESISSHIHVIHDEEGFANVDFPHHDGSCVECQDIHDKLIVAEALGDGSVVICINCVATTRCPHGTNQLTGQNCHLCMDNGSGCAIHTGESVDHCVSCMQAGYRCSVRWRARIRNAVNARRVVYGDTDSRHVVLQPQINEEED